jgi:hypothetical protein
MNKKTWKQKWYTQINVGKLSNRLHYSNDKIPLKWLNMCLTKINRMYENVSITMRLVCITYYTIYKDVNYFLNVIWNYSEIKYHHILCFTKN